MSEPTPPQVPPTDPPAADEQPADPVVPSPSAAEQPAAPAASSPTPDDPPSDDPAPPPAPDDPAASAPTSDEPPSDLAPPPAPDDPPSADEQPTDPAPPSPMPDEASIDTAASPPATDVQPDSTAAPPVAGRSAAAQPRRLLPTVQSLESCWGVVLILAALFVISGIITAIWWPVAPSQPSAFERYFPLENGVTQSFRITTADQEEVFLSTNVEIFRGLNASFFLDSTTLRRALALSAGGTRDETPAEQLERAQQADIADLEIARVTDTRYDVDGTITPTVSLYLVRPQDVMLLALDDQSFEPPLPLLDSQLQPGVANVFTGTVTTGQTYTATLTLEGSEARNTPVGTVADCLRVNLDLQFAQLDGSTRSWYCADVGLAHQESRPLGETGVNTYELIGVSTPYHVAHSTPPAPLTDMIRAAPRDPAGSGALPRSLVETIDPIWLYQDQGAENYVSAPALPVDDMVIYGVANGGVVAVDRANHSVRWRFQAGGAIYGTPVVADGMLYVGSLDRKLYALDLASGAFRWAFTTRDVITASPTVAAGLVFVGSEDSTVYALDARTGEEQWRYTADAPVAASPAYADGRLYVGADDGVLAALDGETGTLQWAFATDSAITADPVVRDGVVYICAYDGTLSALAANPQQPDGEVLWQYMAEATVADDFVVTDDTVYLATADTDDLRAVDIQSGQERWNYHSPTALYGAPLVIGDQIWIARDYNVLAVDVRTGTEQRVIAFDNPRTTTSLSSDGETLFIGAQDGVLRALGDNHEQPWTVPPRWIATELLGELSRIPDALATPPVPYGDQLIYVADFGPIYSVALDDGSYEYIGMLTNVDFVWTPGVIREDTLYVVDRIGTLVAIDLTTGAEVWRVATGGTTWSTPSISGDTLLLAVSNPEETLAYAFDAATGAAIWQRSLPPSPIDASYSLLHNERFYVTAGALHALDPASGETIWASTEPEAVIQLTEFNDVIYAIGNTETSWALSAWEPDTGRNRLLTPLDIPTFPNLPGSIAGGDDRLVLLLQDGTMLAYDTTSGAEIWRKPPVDMPRGAPVVHNGTILIQTKRNHLIARELDDGRITGNLALLRDVSDLDISAGAPIVQDGRVYGAFSQTVFALDLKEQP